MDLRSAAVRIKQESSRRTHQVARVRETGKVAYHALREFADALDDVGSGSAATGWYNTARELVGGLSILMVTLNGKVANDVD